MTGLILKKNANLFSVECDNKIFNLKPRGNLKAQGLFVGDKVEFDNVITKLLPRKNILIRPPLANVDKIFIVISQVPEPDFLLVDKMILCCFSKGITPILVINKEDILDKKYIEDIKKTYKNVLKVIVTSAKAGKVLALKKEIEGICAFAGQSAVGKSSLINALLGEKASEIGDLSKKIERGKQTTRIVTLFACGGGYIADTAGFSSLEIGLIADLTPQEVGRYYPDFLPYISACKYRQCLHKGGQCGIIENVKNGKINEKRYQNYLKIIDNLANFKPKYK